MLRLKKDGYSLFIIEFDKDGLDELIKYIIALSKAESVKIIADGKVKILKIIKIEDTGYHGNLFFNEREILIEMTEEEIKDFLWLLNECRKKDKHDVYEVLEVKFKKKTKNIIVSYITTEYLNYLNKIIERWENILD